MILVKFLSDTSSGINSQSILLGFSILAVYSLAQSNLKWQLYLLSSIIGTTSQGLITLSFFFPQRCIMVGFLRFLYSGQSGTKSKTQIFGETAHRLT